MSLSSVDPIKRIRQLERELCCLKKAEINTFTTPAIETDYEVCGAEAYLTLDDLKLGDGITITAGFGNDLETIADELNIYYTGIATFVVIGDTIKVTTTDLHGNLELVVIDDCP